MIPSQLDGIDLRRGNIHIHALRLYDFIHWGNTGLVALDGGLRDVAFEDAAHTFVVFATALKYEAAERERRALARWYDTLNERYTNLRKQR
jgi:hypothetical protein